VEKEEATQHLKIYASRRVPDYLKERQDQILLWLEETDRRGAQILRKMFEVEEEFRDYLKGRYEKAGK
jgi:hypothetical protein